MRRHYNFRPVGVCVFLALPQLGRLGATIRTTTLEACWGVQGCYEGRVFPTVRGVVGTPFVAGSGTGSAENRLDLSI